MGDTIVSEALYQKLLSCDWLKNCGTEVHTEYRTGCQLEKDKHKAVKGIESTKWENVCQGELGDLTEYLYLDHKKEYNENWDPIVREIKEKYLPAITEKIGIVLAEDGHPACILEDMKFNLLCIMLCDAFSNFCHSDFFDALLEIYLSGHVPCGWKGKYPAGTILVY